ncbi:MAG: hypothetical protein EP329_16170 [Deltaproteobacteria bacterium]|nr:MAG: hypothetical protein EP329_16170 [Deltaproteobacteria bacterium]
MLRKPIVLAPVLALLLLAQCAETRSYTRVAPHDVVLEVVNRTPADLRISVRGRVEGVVKRGDRVRFHHLERGPARLEAQPREAGQRALGPWGEDRELSAELERWEIVTEGSSVPTPPGLADLKVENPSRHAVVVSVDGRRLGRVFGGESQTFLDLYEGPHRVVAATDDGALTLAAEVRLAADGVGTWTIAFAGARLEIVNDTAEPVRIAIDGSDRGVVEAGGTWTSDDEQPGLRVITATSVVSRHPWQAALQLSTAAPTQWRLGTSGATLRVENRSGEAVDLALEGHAPVSVPDGGTADLADLPVGRLAPVATGAVSGQRYAAVVELGGDQRYTWTINPLFPTLRVVNRTRRALVAYVAGDRRGVIAAGQTLLLRHLPAHAFTAEVVDEHGSTYFQETVDPTKTPASTWLVTAVTGSLAVVNDRPEIVDVFLDGRPLDSVEARSERTFGGAEVGSRLVEARGRRSGAVLRIPVEITEETPASVRLEDPTAILEIVNDLGVELRPTGPLADQHAAIPAGESRSFVVPARRATWVLLGPGGVPVARDGGPASGEVVRWEVRPARTSLVVWNQLGEDVAVAIDDQAVGTVAAGAHESFTDVATGQHRLQAVGTASGEVRGTTRVARADEPLKWTLATQPGRILVHNASAERVQVEIDGSLYDAVEARATKAFAHVPPGRHDVVAYGDATGTRHGFGTTVVEGADVLLEVTPPMATLVVENLSGQDIAVRVDGVVVGRLAAGAAPTSLATPAGRRLVQIERLGDHTVTGSELDLAADHAIHLPIPRANVRLVIVNQTEVPLTVRVGDRVLTTVAANSSLMEESVAPGKVELSAVDPEGRVSHSERRTLHAGETATWVLQRAQ